MRSRVDRLRRQAKFGGLLLLLLLAPRPAAAQLPVPTPPILEQDELDFGRLSLAIGTGARALGMGGAFLARPDDATAATWNPAGLSYLRDPEVSLVGGGYAHDSDTSTPGGLQDRVDHTRGYAPDLASLALPITIGSTAGAVQLSYQRVIPYSGDRTIDQVDDPPRVVHASGGFDVLALGTGLKLTDWLRVGVTVNHWFNGYEQERERLQRRRSIQEVDFRISGLSANAGLILHPPESLNVGVVAKTRMSGEVVLARVRRDFFSSETGGPDQVTSNAYRSSDVRLDLPGAIGFGASWRASSPLTISGDYTRTFWSRASIRNYFTLRARPLEATEAPPPDIRTDRLPFPDVFQEAQSDTEELRLGVEYVIISGRLKLPLRAGYVREKPYRLSGAPSFDGVTGGAGLVLGPVLLDAAYVYQWGESSDAQGNVAVRLHRGLVSLIYRHGRGQ